MTFKCIKYFGFAGMDGYLEGKNYEVISKSGTGVNTEYFLQGEKGFLIPFSKGSIYFDID